MILLICDAASSHLQIFKPETVLDWQRRFISRRWTYQNSNPGRKAVNREIKNLILKNDNSLWGCHRIADELKQLGIDLHHTTVNRIIQDFRKNGRIVISGSWSRILKTHWDSIFAMDFMTVDSIFGKRFFLLIVLKLSTREIKYWDVTENPTKEFVRQRVIEIQGQNSTGMHLIHDNSPQFTAIDFRSYGINSINTSVSAPNMKAEEGEGCGQVPWTMPS